MATHDEYQELSLAQKSGASLTVELRSAERQKLAIFRETFLKWVADRTAGTLALGAPDTLALEELPGGPDGMPTLRMDMSWRPRVPASALTSQALVPVTMPVLTDTSVNAAPVSSAESGLEFVDSPVRLADDFQFFPDPSQLAAPVYRELPPAVHPDSLAPIAERHDGFPEAIPFQERAAHQMQRFVAHGRTHLHTLRPALQRVQVHLRVPTVHPSAKQLRYAGGAAALIVAMLGGTAYLVMSGGSVRRPARTAVVAAERTSKAAVPTGTVDVVDPEPEPVPRRLVDKAPAPAAPAAPEAARATPPKEPVGTSGADALRNATTVSAAPRESRVVATASAASAPPVVKPLVKPVDKPAVVRAIGQVAGTANDAVKGALLVTSDPVGAEVSINGVPHGRTPLTIRGLQAGSRVVRLDLAGYERWSWAISVVANRQTPVKVKLHPEQRKERSSN